MAQSVMFIHNLL
uniref:Uncharacterized protein n=1 Tax=Anguilla anguilla TaxID=7936 RepID=A0A0E9VFF0_ANGAN